MSAPTNPPPQELRSARLTTLAHLDAPLERPMIALSFVWLGLLVLDLVQGLPCPHCCKSSAT